MGRMVGNPVGDIRKSVSFMAFVMFTNKKTILKFCPKEKKKCIHPHSHALGFPREATHLVLLFMSLWKAKMIKKYFEPMYNSEMSVKV